MRFCYIDESGCTGTLPSVTSPIQPVFLIAGLFVEQAKIADFTHDFITFKKNHYPKLTGQCSNYLDCMLPEIKGASLRKMARQNRNHKRFAFRVMDSAIKILEKHDVKITGRVWIKDPGENFNGRAVYTTSMQSIAKVFQAHLSENNSGGLIIADSRTKPLNSVVSHSIFTQKFKTSGDSYSRLHEMPVFGHSDNHAGIQMADLICSAIIYPVACSVYCSSYMTNRTHVHNGHEQIRTLFGERLRQLQCKCEIDGRRAGGLIVSDPRGKRSSAYLFKDR